MPYQRQNPNQYDIYTNQVKSLLPDYRSNNEQNTNTIPILQRLFQAQQRQQLNYFIYLFILEKSFFSLIHRNEQRKIDVRNQQSSPYVKNSISTSEHYQKGLSAFCTPASPEQSNSYNTFAWPFSTDPNQKVLFIFFSLSS